jgi:hypothetical protein
LSSSRLVLPFPVVNSAEPRGTREHGDTCDWFPVIPVPRGQIRMI